jgi:acyl-CoA reductase-like NAD-dependent aldehyde dehydrogenase
VSVQRIYVHAELKRTFIDRLAARVKQLCVGDPTRADTDVGPLITPDEADRVEIWIDEAVTAGAHRIGGERLSKTTLKPTILVDPPRDAKVSTHEIFGPATCVYAFDSMRRSPRQIHCRSHFRRAFSRVISTLPSTQPSGSMLRR